jgi:transcriptional regulator with XRE-family HTH domain
MPAHRLESVEGALRVTDEAERARVRREVGLRMRERRQRAGLSQTQVAGLLHQSLSAVSMWENGQRQPNYDKLLRLAALYGVSVGDFFEDRASTASAELSMLEARVATLEQEIRRLSA